MKKLIRKRDKPEYLKRDGTWTSHISEAWIIEEVEQAINAVTIHHLQAVELIYMEKDQPGRYDIVVPLTDAKTSPDEDRRSDTSSPSNRPSSKFCCL